MSGCGILTNGKGTRREYCEFSLDELQVPPPPPPSFSPHILEGGPQYPSPPVYTGKDNVIPSAPKSPPHKVAFRDIKSLRAQNPSRNPHICPPPQLGSPQASQFWGEGAAVAPLKPFSVCTGGPKSPRTSNYGAAPNCQLPPTPGPPFPPPTHLIAGGGLNPSSPVVGRGSGGPRTPLGPP